MKTVLIVDDDPHIRLLLSELISGEGWKAVTADNGVDGLKQMRLTAPDLILLDTRMHIMDGWEFKLELDSDIRFKTTPVFFLSGMGDFHPANITAEGFFHKPFDIEHLLQKIRPFLEGASVSKKR